MDDLNPPVEPGPPASSQAAGDGADSPVPGQAPQPTNESPVTEPIYYTAPATPPPAPPVHSTEPGWDYAPPIGAQGEPYYGPPASPMPPAQPAEHYGTHPDQGHRSGVGVAIAVAIIASLIIGTLAGAIAGFAGARLASGKSLLMPAKITVVPSSTEDPAVAAAAAAVPSVVNLEVTAAASSGSPDENLPQGHPNVPETQGNGSGVAYKRTSGGGTYIITNNHVVEGATKITVRDAAGTRHKATLVGRDSETDIAVVEISDSIPAIALGDSDQLQVGQLVVAIGSPYGLEHSVTSGIVSALGRSIPDFTGSQDGVYPLVNVIQTDAAINPGNSGGALVDRSGKLVGINTAIYSNSTGSNGGIGFAIPAKTARRVAESLISGKNVEHPFLGVVGRTVTEQVSKEESLTVNEGALVVDLTEGTNAVKAGIKKGDVIVKLDKTPIRSMDDLLLQVRKHDVGDEVTVGIIRDGKAITLNMTVGTKPANLDTSQPTTETP